MITTKKSARYTDAALESFFATTPLSSSDKFFLINNDIDTPYRPPSICPKFHIINNPEPLGFAANVNQILEVANPAAADVFFLNNDLIFSKDWLVPLITDKPYILSPLSNRESPYITETFRCGLEMTLEYYLNNLAGFDAMVEAHKNRSSGFINVLVLPFFCVKLPHKVYSVVGKFDEDYGKGGGEDFDYCLRAVDAGFSVRHAAKSFVLHFGGKSSWSGAETKDQQLARESHFFSHFKTKWGERLTSLILRDDDSILKANSDLIGAVAAGEYKKVLALLKS